MDELLSTSGDIDPTRFLQVEMDSHQELVSGPEIILSPAPSDLQRYHDEPSLFTINDELPGAEVPPVTVSINRVDQNYDNKADISVLFPFSLIDEAEQAFSCNYNTFPNSFEERKHVCVVCLYKFKRMDHLKRHMMTHTVEEMLKAKSNQELSGTFDNSSGLSLLKNEIALMADVRRFTCNVCQYRFKRADHLKRHMTRSHPEELALIAATQELSKARQAAKENNGLAGDSGKRPVENSSVTEKDNERKFACTLCDYKFKRRDHLNRHMSVHTDQIILPKVVENGSDRTEEGSVWWTSIRRFSCSICDAKFKRADHLKRHMTKHIDFNDPSFTEINTSAEQEDQTNTTEVIIKEEIVDEEIGDHSRATPRPSPAKKSDPEERRFVCTVCDYRFKRRFHLMRHMIKHTEKKLVNFALGGNKKNEKLSEEEEVEKDNKRKTRSSVIKQNEVPVTFKCNVCDVEFKQSHRLKVHMARHSEDRLFACPHCDYRAKLASILKKHLVTHSQEKPFACHLCNYRGKKANSLKDHVMLMHSDDKPFACQLCDFKAKVPSHLKKHMVSHQEDAPYECPLCDFKAKRAGNLKEHMGTHTNEKRFICNLCNYGTRRHRNLKKHMAIHFDHKPYVCQLCPYRAKLPHYLKDHMKTHTDIKPYSCPLCDYKSRQSRLLKKHIQSHTESFGIDSMEVMELIN